MRKPDSTDIIIALIFLAIGLFLGARLLRVYPSYEFEINLTNPLILDDDFVFCKLLQGEYPEYKIVKNLSDKDFDLEKLCGRNQRKYDEELNFKYGYKNLTIRTYQDIDDFFSGQAEEIRTISGVYYLSKLREFNYYKNYEYVKGIIIKIEDRSKGKIYLWEK